MMCFCVIAGQLTMNGYARREDLRNSMYGDPGTPDINEVSVL